MKASAVELLEVILEERNKKLAKGISLALDKDAFQNTLTYFYKKYNPTKEDVDEVENGLFRTYHTMLKLADYCDIPLEKISQRIHNYALSVLKLSCQTLLPQNR